MFQPKGVFVAMQTPFDQDGCINEKELRRIADFAIGRGVDGLFPIGSIGESVHLSRKEKILLMETVVDQAAKRVRITPGVGTTNPQESIVLAKRAQELGCDGVVVAPPYFYPLSQEMIRKYFETISDAVQIPVILYNIPLFTQPLSYDTVAHLSARQDVVGLKDSSGSMVDFVHFFEKVKSHSHEFSLISGREDIFFPSLMVGAEGCMVATAGILPEIMVEIYKSWKRGDYDTARELQFSILPLIRAMFLLPFPSGFKLALEARGFHMGPPKQPFAAAELSKFGSTKETIHGMMTDIMQRFSDIMI